MWDVTAPTAGTHRGQAAPPTHLPRWAGGTGHSRLRGGVSGAPEKPAFRGALMGPAVLRTRQEARAARGPPRPHGRRAQTAAWALWGPAWPGTRCASSCPPRSDLGGERPRSSSWAALLSAPKVTFHSDSAGCCWAGLFLSRAQAAATRSAQAIGWALSPWAIDHCPFRL